MSAYQPGMVRNPPAIRTTGASEPGSTSRHVGATGRGAGAGSSRGCGRMLVVGASIIAGQS